MKKIVFLLVCIIFTYVLLGNVIANNNLIPDEAIRIRVIANSNSDYDQGIKNKVKDQLQVNLYRLLRSVRDISEARTIIKNNLDLIKNDIDITLQKEKYNLPFTINFGLNYFPKKEFKGIIYNEGYYESVVVTLGEGLGDNWWCVLFPPLCLIEAEESTEVEYTTMVKSIIDKYF